MAQEETHGFMNHRVGDEVVVIYHQIERALPLCQLNKQLSKEGGEAGVLAFLRHCLTGDAMPTRGLLNSSNEIAGKTFLLVVAFIQRKPAHVIFTGSPLGNERCFSVPSRASDQRKPKIVRAGKFSQQTLTNDSMVEAYRAT